MVLIYFLSKNNIPFYVGKTTLNFSKKREYKHKEKFGFDIHMEIIEEIDDKNWKYWECYWIEQFKQWGFKLENKNKGGGGCEKMSEISKKIIGDKNRKPKPNYFKGTKGIKYSEESKQKMRKPKPEGFGKKLSSNIERGRKISQSALGNTRKKGTIESQQARINKSKAAIGKKKSLSHRQNLSTPILQIDLQGNLVKKWDQMQILTQSKLISLGVLYKCLKGIKPNANGFIWKYE
jgi:hypothetical protein